MRNFLSKIGILLYVYPVGILVFWITSFGQGSFLYCNLMYGVGVIIMTLMGYFNEEFFLIKRWFRLKFLSALLLPAIFMSCEIKSYEKPFIITYKCCQCGSNNKTKYYYQDKNGKEQVFTDEQNAYKIGDTIL